MPGPTISEARVARLTRPPPSRDDELLSLRSTVQHLKTSLAGHSECCERITGEIATVREEALRILRTEVEKREYEIVRKLSEKINASAETHRSEITRVDERLNSRLSDQNTLLQAVHSAERKTHEQNNDFHNKLADTVSRTTDNSKGIEQLDGDHATIKETLQHISASYVELDELDRRLQSHLDVHRALNSDVTGLKAELQAVVSRQASTRQSLQQQVDARFTDVDARSTEIAAQFTEVDARFTEVDTRFTKVDARFTEVDHGTEKLGTKLEAVMEQHGSHRNFSEALDNRLTKAMDGLGAQLYTHQKHVDQVNALSLDKTDKLGIELQAVKLQQDSHQTRLQQGDTRSLDTQKLQEKLQERITALEREVASLVKQQQEVANLEVTDENMIGAADIPKTAEVKQSASDTYYDEPSGGVLRYFRFSRKPTTEQKEKLKVGRLFNLNERHDANSVKGTDDGQSDFFTSFQSAEAFLSDGRKPKFKRVKLLLLDTGMDNSKPPCVDSLSEDAAAAFRQSWTKIAESRYSNFVEEEKNTKATDADIKNGHGTHCLGLLLRLIPEAEIHVGRVVTMSGYVDPDAVAKGLKHARENNFRIVSLSLGFSDRLQPIDDELEKMEKSVLVFAATSNSGLSKQEFSWPASKDNVFSVFSAESHFGKASDFNPQHEHTTLWAPYKFVGENIPATGLAGKSHTMSGTSVATPVAAATAAMFLEYLDRIPGEPDSPGFLRSIDMMLKPKGIRHIFQMISTGPVPKFVLPSHLLSTRENVEDLQSHIRTNLEFWFNEDNRRPK